MTPCCSTYRRTKFYYKMLRKQYDLLFAVFWEERNHRLHNTDHIFDMEGCKELLEVMKEKWKQELSFVSGLDYGCFFTEPLVGISQ